MRTPLTQLQIHCTKTLLFYNTLCVSVRKISLKSEGYHPPESFTSLPPWGKGVQTVKLTTYLYQINARPCHASRCMCMRKPGFDSMSVCVGFVEKKMVLGQVLHRALRLSPTSIIPSMLHTHTSPTYHRCGITLATFSS